MPRLGTETGRAAPFVLAPRAEQKRITDQLDAMLARVNACNDHFEGIPAILKRFRQAVLAAATSGDLSGDFRLAKRSSEVIEASPPEWTPATLGSVTNDLRYGTSKKCDYSDTGIGVLRIPNISENGRIDASDLKRAHFDANELDKLSLKVGDLLIIRSNGSVDLVGKTSVVSEGEQGLLFAGYLMRLRLNTATALPGFMRLSLSEPRQRQRIELTSKSTSGVNNINAEELRALPVWLPPIAEQIEIVRRVQSLFAIADRIEARSTAARAQVARLTPLLLAKAFRGELVPQDPNDEPASALLSRIAAERTSAARSPRTRTPRKPASRQPVRASKGNSAMTKSRQDDDVKGQPYLARHLRLLGGAASAEALFKASELPVADFYKQLAWEMAQGHVNDGQSVLEASDAA